MNQRTRISFIVIALFACIGIVAAQVVGPQGLDGFGWLNGTRVNAQYYYVNDVLVEEDVLEYPQQPASYIVWINSGTYYAKNGNTGTIDYSGANAATVIQNAIDATTTGRVFIKAVSGSVYDLGVTSLTLPRGVDLISDGATIYYSGTSYAIICNSTTLYSYNTIEGLNLYYDGSNANAIGIELYESRFVHILDCVIQNFNNTQILIDGGDTGAYYNYIENNHLICPNDPAPTTPLTKLQVSTSK